MLGKALIAKRGERTLQSVADELSITHPTLSRIERGVGVPSFDVAIKLSDWLGWSVEVVILKARQPA